MPFPTRLLFALVLATSLSACHRSAGDSVSDDANSGQRDNRPTRYSLADGPDICFRKVLAALGPEVRVSEITSLFAAGPRIEGDEEGAPQGAMTICSVDYQRPGASGPLLNLRMDPHTGAFGQPTPVPDTGTSDAAKSTSTPPLVALKQINAAKLQDFLQRQQKTLERTYSAHAIEGIRLSALGNTHVLRADVLGLLRSSGARQNGYAAISLNGKHVVYNHLFGK